MFGEEFSATVSSPSTRKLMVADQAAEQVDGRKGNIFHSVSAKLLFIIKIVRPNFKITASFLTKRVSKSDDDEWEKLRRVLIFCKNVIDGVRIIGSTNLEDTFTCINPAYAVHTDMRSHTDGCMSLDIGTIHNKAAVQKLNTKSSTESEIIRVSKYLLYNIWMINFIAAQGYKIKNNIVYQDNQSGIKIDKNGRTSCMGNSRHINLRYFFVTDRVKKKAVDIRYCPTEIILSDFLTKAL